MAHLIIVGKITKPHPEPHPTQPRVMMPTKPTDKESKHLMSHELRRSGEPHGQRTRQREAQPLRRNQRQRWQRQALPE